MSTVSKFFGLIAIAGLIAVFETGGKPSSSSPASAATPPANEWDYSNKAMYTCNEDLMKYEIDRMVADSTAGHFGLKVIYIKNVTEIQRWADELQCSFIAVTNKGTRTKYIFRFYNEDGHHLVGMRRF